MADREHDVVIFGATGFTGRLAAKYLAAHAPPGLRWGIAGRDRLKLEVLRRELAPASPALVVADSKDAPALEALAKGARVVASTAGPFSLYSNSVVDACAAAKTHYVDITGETPWVKRLIDRHHARAAADGTRIVPLCGFDSIPSDLGTWLVVDWLKRQGQATRRARSAFTLGGGGLNGGTAASALAMAESGDSRAFLDSLLLVPPERRAALVPLRLRTRPSWDPTFQRWLAPFVMAPVNTHVVLRSAALHAERGEAYGPSFAYEEALATKGRLTATAVTAALGLGDLALRSRVGRALVRRLVPAPGKGPSEEAMARGFFKTRVVAEAEDGRRALAEIGYDGDAGNRATVLMLVESALALAVDLERLPNRPWGGVLTPSSAFGAVLHERLVKAGMKITLGAFAG